MPGPFPVDGLFCRNQLKPVVAFWTDSGHFIPEAWYAQSSIRERENAVEGCNPLASACSWLIRPGGNEDKKEKGDRIVAIGIMLIGIGCQWAVISPIVVTIVVIITVTGVTDIVTVDIGLVCSVVFLPKVFWIGC